MSDRLSISLVTFNSAGIIAGCLESIPPETPVFVCDNASRDDTIAVIRKVRPDAVITKARRNLGFGRAHNINLRQVKTEFGIVMNPDARFLPGSLEQLLETADIHQDAAIIGGQHYDGDGQTRVVSSGTDTYCVPLIERKIPISSSAKKHPDNLCCVEFIIGAMMLFRMDIMRRIGLFDRRIFMYHEDVEICARARKNGYTVLLEPLAKVIHLCGQSSGTSAFVARLKQFYHSQCKLLVFKKYHGEGMVFCRFAFKELMMQLRRFLKALLKRDWLMMNKHAAGIYGVFSGWKRKN